MTDRTDRSTRSTTKTTWQPSARGLSSRSYSGSFTTRGRAADEVSGGWPRLSPSPHGRLAGVVVLIIVAGLVAGWVWRDLPSVGSLVAPRPVATVDLARGPVQLSTGTALAAGAVLDTGPGERLAVRLADDGPSVRVDADSRVRLVSPTRLELERGAVYVDGDRPGGPSVEVRTTFGVVRDIGTQFEVRLLDGEGEGEGASGDGNAAGSTLRVRVREGEIVLTTEDGAEHGAVFGEQLKARAGGTVERALTPTFGESWSWVLVTAAVPDIEGRPLGVFLDWLMREGGWTLAYADGATEARVAATSLHGTIDGLNAEEAMPMVLEGSGLGFTIEDDRFVLRTADDASP